jgi:CheY-like chemotaxis protein
VDRLTELVEKWRGGQPPGEAWEIYGRCATELEAALAAELSDAKKRETQPATPSVREFAKSVIGMIAKQFYPENELTELITAHDAEIVEAAFRLATRQLGGEFSAGVPDFTEALAKHDAEIIAEALREALELVCQQVEVINKDGRMPGLSPHRRGVTFCGFALKGKNQRTGSKVVQRAERLKAAILALIPARPENAKPAGT